VLDGLLLAADVTGAERAIIYLSHPETVAAVSAALSELAPDVAGRVETHVVAHRYVAGEESAVCSSLNGGPALPKAKPPRVFESGVDGLPTLVSNVETLAQAAWIARNGADAYRSCGTASSPGTGLVTLQGACARPGVYEVPYGISVRELLTACGGTDPAAASGLLMGGWFGGIADLDVLDQPWCFDALGAAGSALGCGSVTLLGSGERVADVAARLARWYASESAGQCGVCRKGTSAVADALERLRDDAAHQAAGTDLANLTRWGTSLRGKGACAFLDGAATLARTAVTHTAVSTVKELA
jgi:NADH:ubiquinone oxidoreductase subunit F (NADH-binding)